MKAVRGDAPGVIVHDWIEPTGGSEKVVDEFMSMFPGVPLFCLWNNDPGRFPGHPVHESWLASTPLRDKKALSLAFMSRTMRRADPAPSAEWALVSSHSFAHHFGSDGKSRRVPTCVYVHSPPRYLWAPEVEPRGQSAVVRSVAGRFRRTDRTFAGTGASYAVNSAYVAERASRAWQVPAQVIHPPIDVTGLSSAEDSLTDAERRRLDALPPSFVLGASRFVSYKRLEHVIVFGQQTGQPVVLAGSGDWEPHLRAAAAASTIAVTFYGRPSDAELAALYRRCTVYVFPPVEDFGMMPAEALACGARVVVNNVGGSKEIIERVGGGVTHDFRSGDASTAYAQAQACPPVPAETIRSVFGRERFHREVRAWMARTLPVQGVESD